MSTTPKDILVASKDLILKKGWCQNKLRDGESRVCMLGALGAAYDANGGSELGSLIPELYYTTRSYLYRALGSHEAAGGVSIADYNDEPGRKLEEVIAKFDEAITLADAEVVSP